MCTPLPPTALTNSTFCFQTTIEYTCTYICNAIQNKIRYISSSYTYIQQSWRVYTLKCDACNSRRKWTLMCGGPPASIRYERPFVYILLYMQYVPL